MVTLSFCTSVGDKKMKNEPISHLINKPYYDTLHLFFSFNINKISNKVDIYFRRKIRHNSDSEYIGKYTWLESMTKTKGDFPLTQALPDLLDFLYHPQSFMWHLNDSVKNADASRKMFKYITRNPKGTDISRYITVIDINEDKTEDLLIGFAHPKNPTFSVWLGTKNGKYKKTDFFKGAFYGTETKKNKMYLITGWWNGVNNADLVYNIIKNHKLVPVKRISKIED